MVVLAAAALGIGIVKLPGATNSTNHGTGTDQIGDPAASSGPVQSPPPSDNLATPAQGTLTLGDSSAVGAISLATNGASTTVSAPGQPWDGLEIDVPAGAWPGATLQITAQPITGSSFGSLVTPASPLYTVSGAEGMAPAPVTLKIPATIPDDSFAMGFFYDASGHLEGMPLLAEDGTSVTVATGHFSNFFLSLVNRALLPTTIDSGFRPGKDDWQFKNLGSFVALNGQCTGQTLTEAWYYIERHLKGGASRLYGLYDNNGAEKTPKFQEDDSDGYRLASVAQTQYAATHNAIKSWSFRWRGKGFDTLQYNAFRYAIAVTGEPQLVSISDAQDQIGHEILAYRVAPVGIFVADPNFPAAWRLVPFDPASGKFGTYFSGTSASAIAQGDGVSFTNFVYDAKTALVDWSALAADWAAFDDGTIGDGVFPAYKLEALASQDPDVWVPLVEGYKTADEQLTIQVSSPNPLDEARMKVYRDTSSTLAAPPNQEVTIDLSEGENPLGILVQGTRQGWKNWEYVDFVRLTVTLAPETQSPGAGRWVLVSAESGGGANQSYDVASTVVSTNGRISTSASWEGSPPGNVAATVSWGPPPASAVPGDTWTTTLSAEETCSDEDENWTESLTVRATWIEPGGYGTKEWNVEATCQKGSGSTELSWAFPVGWAGSYLSIFAQGYEASGNTGGDTWTYSYEWQP